jgi:hypothetical protein
VSYVSTDDDDDDNNNNNNNNNKDDDNEELPEFSNKKSEISSAKRNNENNLSWGKVTRPIEVLSLSRTSASSMEAAASSSSSSSNYYSHNKKSPSVNSYANDSENWDIPFTNVGSKSSDYSVNYDDFSTSEQQGNTINRQYLNSFNGSTDKDNYWDKSDEDEFEKGNDNGNSFRNASQEIITSAARPIRSRPRIGKKIPQPPKFKTTGSPKKQPEESVPLKLSSELEIKARELEKELEVNNFTYLVLFLTY